MERNPRTRAVTGAAASDAARNLRNATLLVCAYLLLFGGFIGINAIPGAMETEVLGLNLAVIYGVGLAVAAIVFALCYARLRRVPGAKRRIESN
jgi:nitrate/nitrite transporter NarK